MSQAMAKHRHMKETEGKNTPEASKDKTVEEHLARAKEHIEHAHEIHTKGTKGPSEQGDARSVNEEPSEEDAY